MEHLMFTCTVCGWKYDPAEHPPQDRPETFTPTHYPNGEPCRGSGTVPFAVSAEPRESCDVCKGPAGDDGQRTADTLLCAGCADRLAGWTRERPRAMPARSVYTRESGHPPELGGEAG